MYIWMCLQNLMKFHQWFLKLLKKQNVSDTRSVGRTDGLSDTVKTVYPPTNTVCGGYNEYPCKPQFYYINVGCKGVFISRTCLHDEPAQEKGGYGWPSWHDLSCLLYTLSKASNKSNQSSYLKGKYLSVSSANPISICKTKDRFLLDESLKPGPATGLVEPEVTTDSVDHIGCSVVVPRIFNITCNRSLEIRTWGYDWLCGSYWLFCCCTADLQCNLQ